MLEVCVDSLESGIQATRGGADELEVCGSLAEGGLTPSAGLVKLLLDLKGPKINVMLRCRSGSDFSYNKTEMETMLADLEVFKSMGVDRFVFGALTESQVIDNEKCKMIIDAAGIIPVTFHRAFDVCVNPQTSIKNIIGLGFSRLLTSGQRPSAGNADAVLLIKSLQELHGNKIEIMPGAGVSSSNAGTFINLGCKIIHSSCKLAKSLPKVKNTLAMGSNETEVIYMTDENIVRKIKEVISKQNFD